MREWTWSDVGARVAAARKAAGKTQAQLAADVDLERTAISKLEKGTRTIDARELVRISVALGRSLEWFVTEGPAAVVNRRAERDDQREDVAGDAALEDFVRDVATLVAVKALRPVAVDRPIVHLDDGPADGGALAAAAQAARTAVGVSQTEPVLDLIAVAERVGLYTYVPVLGDGAVDGAYVFDSGVGACVVNGSQDAGRRRYTLAHELGHHLLGDAYSSDWGVGAGDHERAVNAFAGEFLLPEPAIRQRWPRLVAERGGEHAAAIALGIDFRLSWSAVLRRLRHVGVISKDVWSALDMRSPTKADYLAAGTPVYVEMEPPVLSPGFSAAVLWAYRTHRLTADRAVEMLRFQLTIDDLPPRDVVPLEAIESELY